MTTIYSPVTHLGYYQNYVFIPYEIKEQVVSALSEYSYILVDGYKKYEQVTKGYVLRGQMEVQKGAYHMTLIDKAFKQFSNDETRHMSEWIDGVVFYLNNDVDRVDLLHKLTRNFVAELVSYSIKFDDVWLEHSLGKYDMGDCLSIHIENLQTDLTAPQWYALGNSLINDLVAYFRKLYNDLPYEGEGYEDDTE